MAVVAAPPPGIRRVPVLRVGNRWLNRLGFSATKVRSVLSSNSEEREGTAPGVSHLEISSSPPNLAFPQHEISSSASNLRFDRLRPLEEECVCRHKRVFNRFIAREALFDEEYWTAAWLRAESHWEDQPDVRYIESYKRQFADQHFNLLKRKCSKQHTEKCICFVAVKKDDRNIKRTVLNSVVGTLDLSIKHLLHGETFPGECMKRPTFPSTCQADQPRYGYVANLCVAKYARRQGIASNMLFLALEAAISYGANEIFVHVHKDNIAAQKLYDQIGFQMVETAIPCLLAEKYLLCLKA